ncbi:MAG TPA: multiheme c-type cytochrome [Kofleriaceae bacterium]|nr:multiheme c-type cytochrome [Kofleriaceae bacterium]
MRRAWWLWLTAGCAVLLACSSRNGKPIGGDGSGDPEAAGERLTLFFSTELKGQLEPCGCTSDPMGDLARTAALVESARAGGTPVLFFDGGSMLYEHEKPSSEEQLAHEKLKAGTLLEVMEKKIKPAAAGVGPFDLAGGEAEVKPDRQAVNLPAGSTIRVEPPKVVTAGKVKVGVFGLSGMQGAGDPVEAGTKAAALLRGGGAQVVVALAHMPRADAVKAARKMKGVDFVLVGQKAPEPGLVSDEPLQAGDAWVFQPGNRGQIISRLELGVHSGGGVFVDAVGAPRVQLMKQRLAEAQGDAARVADLQDRLAELEARAKQKPAGSWFTLEQVRIRKQLACDTDVVAAQRAFDQKAGDAAVAAVKAKGPPPAAKKGEAGYVGIEECSMCHQSQVEFWKTTVHAKAWETLVGLGKDKSFDCVGCHVTGWEEPGGSNLAFNESLRDVQCENCHGPGSRHVEANGKEKTPSLRPGDGVEACMKCHTPEHSDTFDREAYLRDVTGKGHGEAFRARLGDGPTGHALRAAAVAKAGSEIGAGCAK